MQGERGIELNEGFRRALAAIEAGRNVFVTGRAGTGKSTLLRYLRESSRRRLAVVAPTGVAAVNAGGQTIHSFFGWRPGITPAAVQRLGERRARLYRSLEALVIDEASMVRADLLDCMDRFLRLNGPRPERPFGGLQVVLFGDLYQLPPVVSGLEGRALSSLYETPYFFSARCFPELDLELVELEKVYRQQGDPRFLAVLDAIRSGRAGEEELALLNSRVLPDFDPPAGELYVRLVATNAQAEAINARELARLPGRERLFLGQALGDFGREYLPTALALPLKPGAQVMLVNNDPRGRWVNGSLGRVVRIVAGGEEGPRVLVRLQGGPEVAVGPHTWELQELYLEGGELRSRVVGSFTQLPLMLAWALTVHRAQGKTFPRVVVDLGRGAFAPGQVYVALSRCTCLEGLVLRRPLQRRHIWADRRVVQFLTRFQYRRAREALPLERRLELAREAMARGQALRLTYLKPNDERSQRLVLPLAVGEMEHGGRRFLGLRGYCLLRREERVFRLDRVLEMELAEAPAPEGR